LMELIPANFRNLGGPPSFETCTRDTYPSETVFTLAEVIKISASIASVGKHLHALGVSHGDLYAHNTLVDEEANTLFGDFGAGSTYHVHSSKAAAIQRLEVRAFACLLDDLLRYLQAEESDQDKVQILQDLVIKCMDEVVLARPSFEEIYERISSLK
jgi:serine/threonine protein kinase